MKHFILAVILFVLSACGSDTNKNTDDGNDSLADTESFILHNIRFDAKDYYDAEQVTVTAGTIFEVQWVTPTSAAYLLDFYLSTNGAEPSDSNKIGRLNCGNASFSLCPNATGEVQCEIDDNSLSCFVGSDFVGNQDFQDKDLSSLRFIIKGCDALNSCDIKSFNLSVDNSTVD